MNNVHNNKKFKFSILIISFILQILVLTTGLLNYLSFTNTLSKNANWQTTKNQLYHPASDGTVFADQTQALASNSLDLSAWRAWNEIYLKNYYSWKTLSLEFLPSKNSYLYIIFNRTEENFSAIRISYSPLYDSALVNAKYTGEFTEVLPLTTIFLSDGWQNLTIERVNSSSPIIEFWYNNQLITSHKFTNSQEGKIGLRSGKEQILVDNIRIKDNQNQIIFSDNFDQFDQFFSNFVFLLILLVILNLIIFLTSKILKVRLKPLFQLNFSVCLILLMINFFLLFLSSEIRNRYPSDNSLFNKIKSRKNNQDYSVINDKESDQIFTQYSTEFDKESISRIMFIGSSQTQGEGSGLKDEDFVSQFANLIRKANTNEEKKFEIINTGIPGLPSCELFKYFEDKWIKLKPQWVIINLSINDEEYGLQSSFANCLNKFIEVKNNNNFILIFMAEAISIEKSASLNTHRLMRKIARENDIIFIDMQNYVASQINKGIIWWDFAHPTSFGHQLIANHLFKSLKPILLNNLLNEN